MGRTSIFLVIWFLAAVPAAEAGDDGGFGNFFLDLGQDALALPTWGNACWLIGGAAAAWGAYEVEDADGAKRALNRGATDSIVGAGNVYGDLRFQVPLAFTVWSFGRSRGNERVSAVGYDLIRALSLNYAVTGALKPTFNRTRPNGEDYSFPSGHSSAAFATAGVVSRHCGRWWTGAALTAGVVTGLGRMEDEKHYASDVVAGATLGWIIGRTVARGGEQRDSTRDGQSWRLSTQPGGVVVTRRF